jgi:Fe-S cluster assembly protein SufD
VTEAAVSAGAVSRDKLDALLARSPTWLADRRSTAWDAFTALPMPSSARDEDWRRTDISKLRLGDLGEAAPAAESAVEAARLRHQRGAPAAALLIATAEGTTTVENADSLLAQGAILCSLDEAVRRHPELVRRGLAGIGIDESYFVALWNALWRGGAFVYVPSGVEAMTPVWVAQLAPQAGGLGFPATVVVVDEHASLTLLEDMIGDESETSARCTAAVTALVAGRQSRLDDIAVQQLPGGTWHFATRRAQLGAAARYRLFGATLGSRLQKAYWDVMLEGEASEADILAVCFTAAQQHIDHQSLQLHRGRDTRSNLLLKVAARDRAHSVYSGLIDVEPAAIHADGYVSNRNLLLSHGASASGVPRLEIKANDVKCGHGTTVGHVDDEERFYLMARGVPPEEAERIIVRGFFADVLDRVPGEPLRDWLLSLLDAEIAGSSEAERGS